MTRRFIFIFALLITAILVFTACDIQQGAGNGGQTPGGDQGSDVCVHSFSSWEIEQQATCKDEGVLSRSCSKCGEKESSKISVTDVHTEVIDAEVAPTCTETGLTAGKHCSVCGWVFISQSEVAAKGHKYTNDYDANCNDCGTERDVECGHFEVNTLPAKEVKCTEDGLTEGKICSSCEEILLEQTVIAAPGHNVVVDKAVAPTCTTLGKTQGKHCSNCDEIFVAQSNIKALGHNESDWIIEIEPTDTEDGYKYKKCSTCGEKTAEGIIPFIGDLGIDYEINSDGATCTVTGIGSFNGTELVIPDYIRQYKVTAIGEKAFENRASLTKLVIPETTKTIGARAFYGCTGLTEFTIPASVTDIGAQIFYKAENLTTVYYNSTYSSSTNQILNTTSIKTVVFGGKSVPSYILNDCSSVTTVIISEGITSIGSFAFNGCSSLTSIVIPDSVTSIGDGAFYGCRSLTSIVIPDNVTNIYFGAFVGCSSLTSVVIGDGVTSIGGSAFYDCSSLTSIVIPDSVTSISDYAFSGCSSLTSIVIPDSVTSISDYAFYGCRSLTSIVIPDSVTSIGDYAFNSSNSLTDVYYTGSEEHWSKVSIDDGNASLTNATVHFNYIPEE